MPIELKDARPGDFVLFQGGGPVFRVLSFLLCLFDRRWRRLKWKPWHVAWISRVENGRAAICESLAAGVEENPLDRYPAEGYRIYRWFDREPSAEQIAGYLQTHLGKPYDVAVYFWTALQYLVRHYWNRKIPRLLDDRYTCWENLWEFAAACGKPLSSPYDYPLITDLVRDLDIH